MAGGDIGEQQLLSLIGELYDASIDPSRWWPMASKLAALFDSESCLLLVADTQSGKSRTIGLTENLDAPFWAGYEAHYQREDLWVAGGIARAGRSVLGQELAPEEWYRKSAYINELCLGAGIYYLLGVALPLGANKMGVLGIHRSREQPSFDEAHCRTLKPLVSHLTRALQLAFRLEAACLDHQASLDDLERTGAATMVVDRTGRILFTNGLAEALLHPGNALHAINGRLGALDRNAATRLAYLIQSAADTAAGLSFSEPGAAISLERDDGRLPLTVLVAPFRPKTTGFGAPIPAAIVFIRDPERPSLSADLLRDLFGLTPAQAAVAVLIGDGKTLDEIALALRISLHTARDHLKIIFAKTGTARQPQLVALLLRTIAGLRNP